MSPGKKRHAIKCNDFYVFHRGSACEATEKREAK